MDEPVAYINVEERKLEWASPIKWETPTVVNLKFNIPLYTAPPQRDETSAKAAEWVGLTDEETNALIQRWAGELVFEVTQALKEKNT